MKSSFQFLNYKIDKIELAMAKNISLITYIFNEKTHWSVNMKIRKPQFFENDNVYVGGIDVNIISESIRVPSKENPAGEYALTINASIIGTFKTEEKLAEDVEINLVKTQMPAILFPYLRAAITNIAASTGFGTIILPLINIQKWASDNLKDVSVDVVPKPQQTQVQES